MTSTNQNHDGNTQTSAFGETDEILTAAEVSRQLRLPLSSVYHLAKTGALPAFQLGRSWRFSSAELGRLTRSTPLLQHILVVDDDAVTRLFVKELLSSRNRTVTEAGTVDEAMAAIRDRRFDLFLVDFKLPGKDGTEFIRQLRHDYSLTQVVMITAFADLAQADEMFALGAVTMLRKPLQPAQLIECANRILGASRPPNNHQPAKNTNSTHAHAALITSSERLTQVSNPPTDVKAQPPQN